jgi:hypothetical protein
MASSATGPKAETLLAAGSTTSGRSESAEHGTSAGGGLLQQEPSSADARSISADPIKRYHKDQQQSGGGGSANGETAQILTRSYPVVVAIQDYVPVPGEAPEEALPLDQGQIVEVLDNKNPTSWLVRTKAKPPQTGWVPGSYFETPSKYYTQRRTTRELMGAEDLNEQQQALLKRESVNNEN